MADTSEQTKMENGRRSPIQKWIRVLKWSATSITAGVVFVVGLTVIAVLVDPFRPTNQELRAEDVSKG
jgi:hypothetical protein